MVEFSRSIYFLIILLGVDGVYSHSRKTVNTRKNLWNVYCFATNQKRHETAKGNRQTAACISHDLIWNNELAFSSNELAFLPRLT